MTTNTRPFSITEKLRALTAHRDMIPSAELKEALQHVEILHWIEQFHSAPEGTYIRGDTESKVYLVRTDEGAVFQVGFSHPRGGGKVFEITDVADWVDRWCLQFRGRTPWGGKHWLEERKLLRSAVGGPTERGTGIAEFGVVLAPFTE